MKSLGRSVSFRFSWAGAARSLVLLSCIVLCALGSSESPLAGQEAAPAASLTLVQGLVRDALTGEPLARVLVAIREQGLETTTDADGRFRLESTTPAEVEILASTVGYGTGRKKITLPPGSILEVEFLLGPEALTRSDQITVTGTVFEPIEADAPLERSLSQNELKNLAGVVSDDPLRAVQGLPGVATGDDFSAEFTVRGLGFEAIGFHIDSALVAAPFHTVQGIQEGGSLTLLNSDLIETISLISGAAPARFGDRTSATLNVQTREGSREGVRQRGNASSTGLGWTGEGPLGRSRQASWLAAVRKSYLDYVIERVSDDSSIAFGFYDVQGKTAVDLGERHRLFLTVLHGDSGLSRDRIRAQLGPNGLYQGDSLSDLVDVQWQWLPSSRNWLTTTGYATRDDGINRNTNGELLYQRRFRQAGLRFDTGHQLSTARTLEAGFHGRILRDSGLQRSFDARLNRFREDANYSSRGAQPGFYLQHTWNAWSQRFTWTVGGRYDYLGTTSEGVWLPRAAAAVSLSKKLRLTTGFGQQAQFPGFDDLFGQYPNRELQSERSTQYVAGLDYQIGEKMRLRLEGYGHREKSRLFAPETEYRLVAGRAVAPIPGTPLRNALEGWSRGVELLLQRRSANGLSGWLSYSFGRTSLRDELKQLDFDSDYDQRHTLNAYGSWRITRTVNLSTKYRYGSNFPIAGFFRQSGTLFYLSEFRNRLRQPVYSRLDFRINKAWIFDRWKMTLYFEMVNLLNRENIRYTGVDRATLATQRVFLDSNTLFPILPTIGMLIEF